VSLIKYGVNREELLKLLELGICQTEEEALEKVASGEASGLIKQAMENSSKQRDKED
jgi:hypothetical protein